LVMTDLYRRPADLPPVIPVFPLRGAILLPRATLPLNIFEPRYLAMVEAAMSGSRVIGLLQPDGGSQEEESPSGKNCQLRPVGCVGRITTYQELEDGRYIITLTGVARFKVVNEVSSEAPFRVMKVSYDDFANDFQAGFGENEVDRDRLLHVLRNYLDANNLKADWNAILRASSEVLINALSVMSPYGPEEKQALLEAPDLKSRADVLIALAEMELASGGATGGTLQ